ncbi:MAG: HD domain-containing protein [Treponema sp.]|nr:HD domain-containing protein [Treponema sp.]
MIQQYYIAVFALSLILTIVYAVQWHKHFPIYFSLIFALIPIANLGYLLTAQAQTIEAVLTACKVTYIGGCYLILFSTLCIFYMCNVKLSNKITALLLTISSILFAFVLTIGKFPLFYKSVSFISHNGIFELEKEYGPVHKFFYILLALYFAAGFVVMIYSYLNKKDASRKTIVLLFLSESINIIAFFTGRTICKTLELIPLAYVCTQALYLIIVNRICLYDIAETSIDSLVQTGDTGFVSFDFKYNYLGSNETARNILPELRQIRVDTSAKENPILCNTAVKWIDKFKEDETNDISHYEKDDCIYQIDVNYLYDGPHKKGYQLFITDDTQDQKYIALIDQYNERLQQEVQLKTRNILDMHNKLVLGMASMVESRDNSTGGHIKRTSDTIAILISQIKADNRLNLSEKFCDDLIKAAPMHDLGKIAVDDAILRKPGRFEQNEFEKMKCHAKEGARIVHEILEGTDDIEFHIVAENVAHYHHERWDGSGYPEALKGEAIPLEARIMAIVDVYDALVSKRCYKEKMSFAEADKIIMNGMGTQFDKQLEPYYVKARPYLEEYYASLDSTADIINDRRLEGY